MILAFFLCCFGVIIGFISLYLAVGLDSMMDWGGIFSKYRYNKFLQFAKDNHKDLITKSTLVYSMEANEGESKGTTRANFMHSLYLELSADLNKFKLYICIECMSVRIAVYINILAHLFCILFLGGSWFLLFNLPFSFLVIISVIYFNIKNGKV